ncbi:polysaccharide lyase 8 family protein [Myceligenerans crystallogenes]
MERRFGKPLTRRDALILGTAASLAIAVGTPDDAAAAPLGHGGLQPSSDFDALRDRWTTHLTGGAGIGLASVAIATKIDELSRSAARHYDTADHSPASGGDIWPDLPMQGPAPAAVTTTYRRILTVATAWSTPGAAQYHAHDVERALVTWYRHMTDSWYNPSTPPSGNWWFWEIGIPRVLGDLTLLLAPVLPQDDAERAVGALRHFTPDPNRIEASDRPATGANRADKCLACLLRGIAARSADDIAAARDALSDSAGGGANSLFAYVTSGDGFYSDGSYLHHERLPQAGTYGKSALAALAPSVMLLDGSPWDLPRTTLRPLLDSVERTFAPFLWNGRMMETVRGRAVARQHETGQRDGWDTVEAVMLLAGHVDRSYRETYLGLAKGWLERSSGNYLASATTLSDLKRAEALLGDHHIAPAPEPLGHVRTPYQERMAHRGAGWAYSVATSSARIGRYGWGNGENRYGWHQGDGAAYLYLDDDNDQFADDYWPTVDPYRLPGTTASIARRIPGPDAGTPVPRADNVWGGGVSLAGRWGTAGMNLTNELGDVRGKKSWFLLEDGVVAIGSGIIVTGPGAETTIENRAFRPGPAPGFVVDGSPLGTGERRELDAPAWAHLDGVAGYVFLGDYAARAVLGDRSGSWRDINSGPDTAGSTDTRTRTYATLSLVHPSGTGGDRYAYVILPRASAAQTRAHAMDSPVQVLRKDPLAHVVRVQREDRWYLFAHLWEAVDDGPVRADGPCALLVTGSSDEARIAVSDPTCSVSRLVIRFEVPQRYDRVAWSSSRLQVGTGDPMTVAADLAGSRGASFTARVV